MTHTPLPWEVQKLDHVNGELWLQIGHAGRGPIAELKYLVASDEQQWSDANLIVAAVNACGRVNPTNPVAAADAFPKLLVACEQLLSHIAYGDHGNIKDQAYICIAVGDPTIQAIKIAIKNAKGQ